MFFIDCFDTLLSVNTISPLVSDEQKRHFRENGYCVVDALFTPQEIEEIEVFFENYKTQGYETFDGHKAEDVDINKLQLRAIHPHVHCEEPLNWALNPKVAEVLAELFECPPLLVQTMYYFKPPGACGQGMHQDDFYLLTRPHHCMAAWTAIDDADRENGCLYMVPGSHKGMLKCPDGASPENSFKEGVLSLAESTQKAVPLEVKRGQTAFFGGAIIHGSSANRSKTRSRRSFIGHYCDTITESIGQYYHPVRNMKGEVLSTVTVTQGGGPCGDGWQGAQH